jgi:hypothetical protein
LPNHGLVQGSKFKSQHRENNTLSTCNGDFAKSVCLLVLKSLVSMCTKERMRACKSNAQWIVGKWICTCMKFHMGNQMGQRRCGHWATG